ncbi:MAG: FHA domain-containing protein, partial [Polyangiaceae bacterium]
MIPGFGKQTILIGSAPHCEIRLGGPGVAPEHARIVHQGGGQLVFVDGGTGQTSANGQALQPASTVPFDFRTQFVLGQAALPNAHPAIALMLLDKGQLAPTPGELTVGRDAARCHVVVHNQNVSGRHATFRQQPFSVTDHGSTSGTWIGQERLAPEQPRPLDPSALIAIGPVPVAASVVQQLLAGGQAAAGAAPGAAGAAAGGAAAGGGGNSGPRKKHKTVIGQVQLGGSTGAAFKSIGRTEDNDITIAHP